MQAVGYGFPRKPLLGSWVNRADGATYTDANYLEDWVQKSIMGRRSDALILALLLIGLASSIVAVLYEERRGFLILAVIFGALAGYTWYRRAR